VLASMIMGDKLTHIPSNSGKWGIQLEDSFGFPIHGYGFVGVFLFHGSFEGMCIIMNLQAKLGMGMTEKSR